MKPGSLLARDFASGQLPAGQQGPPGAPGAAGAPGSALAYASVYENNSNTMVLDPSATKNFTSITPATQAGEWCLTPAAGVDPLTHPAVVSPRIFTFSSDLFVRVEGDTGAPGTDCPVGHSVYIVKANYADGGGAVNVNFDIVVP